MDKARRKMDRNVEQVKRRIRELDEKMKKDVIDLFGLRYSESSGLESVPVEIKTEVFSGTVEFPTLSPEEAAEPGIEPERYEVDGAFVEPLSIIVSPYCILLAVKVGHSDSGYRIKLDWVKQRTKEKSRVYLIDPENSEYYYPNSTDLRGEVVAGSPRTGLIAFDPLRRPTSTLEIHFSDVKLQKKRGARETFRFAYEDAELPETARSYQEQKSFSDELTQTLERERDRVWKEVEQSSGCSIVLLLLAGSLSAALVLVGAAF